MQNTANPEAKSSVSQQSDDLSRILQHYAKESYKVGRNSLYRRSRGAISSDTDGNNTDRENHSYSRCLLRATIGSHIALSSPGHHQLPREILYRSVYHTCTSYRAFLPYHLAANAQNSICPSLMPNRSTFVILHQPLRPEVSLDVTL